MRSKMNRKHKIMAYILHEDDDFKNTQKEIADLFHVSQSTISNAIKDFKHILDITSMQKELDYVKQQLIDAGIHKSQGVIDIIP